MNLLIHVLLVSLCAYAVSCLPFENQNNEPTLNELRRIFEHTESGLTTQVSTNTNTLHENPTLDDSKSVKNETGLNRSKRQLAVPLGFRSYDYGDYYGGLTGDYNYDYYDWVCSETRCRVCNILGGECCDPADNPNCFLPDTCLNNPCLAGGSCVTTTTLLGNPDFLCICLPGLTGKYCQITNDYIVDGFMPNIPIGPAFPPHGPFPPPNNPFGNNPNGLFPPPNGLFPPQPSPPPSFFGQSSMGSYNQPQGPVPYQQAPPPSVQSYQPQAPPPSVQSYQPQAPPPPAYEPQQYQQPPPPPAQAPYGYGQPA